ncbi:N-acetyltransferase [Bacteroidia bacterium]|nr:N-acetyltransferase [Bacteroidia bacterium]GHT04201.1 N-acetyltransferase [Bacteroidia bacterium]
MFDAKLLLSVKLEPDMNIKPLDCGDTDLNDFLFEDAKNYYDEMLGVTYLVEYDQKELAAYYCLFNDKIVFDFSGKDDPKRNWWKGFNKKNKIHFKKHRKTYPAVKIGRLAVDFHFKGNSVGSYILKAVITMLIGTRDIGCRFITVDAYSDSLGFYLKNGFEFLSDEDENDKTRQMYYDLKKLS